MKLLSLALLLTLFINNWSNRTSSLDEGLVAYYSFNDCDARDDSGGGSDGVLYGDPGCYCGVEDDALLFDGVNDYIEFQGRVNRYFTTSDFSVSFYFKTSMHSVFNQSLLSKRAACDEFNMIDFQLDAAKGEVSASVYESPYKYYRDISPEMAGTTWQHFALVREGTKVFTFINGQLRREANRCSGVDVGNEALLAFSNSPCLFGGRAVRFKGSLDELRVYSRALSQVEISELYARYPVELAEIDCVSFLPEQPNPGTLEKSGTAYICGF